MTDMKRLLAEATPLPWTACERGDPSEGILTYRQQTVIGYGEGNEARGTWAATAINKHDREDAALIVAAVNAVPDYEAAVDALAKVADLSEADIRDEAQGLCFFCGAGWEWVPGPRGGKPKRKHTSAHEADCMWVKAREVVARLRGAA